MIYSHALDSFNLYSTWVCKLSVKDGIERYFIAEGPYEDSKTLEFPIDLPVDAVIARAWISVTLGSPLTGAKYKTVNNIDIDGSGIATLEGITATTTSYTAVFRFMANGAVYQDTNTHTATLAMGTPTINVEYTSESEDAPEIDENAPGNITRTGFDGGRLPRLLDENLSERVRLEPVRMTIDLNLYPLSTASMELPAGQPEVKARDYMELFSPEGSVGIFRVTETETNYGAYSGQTVYLEQALTTLADDLTIGVQPMTGTFRAVVSSILEAQSVKRWVLGDVDLPDDYEIVYEHSYETVLQAITKVSSYLPEGYAWETDTLQYPWVLHLRNYGTDSFCECRLNRNLSNVQINIDTSDLCTRVYPYGAGEEDDRINLATLTGALFVDSDTKDTWGIVAKTFTDDNIFDAITLKDVADRYLDRHKNPTISITLDAISLYAATGKSIDHFTLGRLCRLPMPSYGIIMHERVIAINYTDVYNKPGAVTVTLANKIRNASDETADLLREATNSKLLGGVVETEEYKSSAGEITYSDPMVHHFDVTTYGNLLSAKVRYTATNEDGQSTRCRLRVDGTTIDGAPDMAQPIDILRYLSTDDNGVPTVGDHYVELSPVATNSSVEHWIHSTVILKTIERN